MTLHRLADQWLSVRIGVGTRAVSHQKDADEADEADEADGPE